MSGKNDSTPEIDEFFESGEIEFGAAPEKVTEEDEEKPKKSGKKASGRPPREEKAPAKEAASGDDDEDEDPDGDDEDGEDEDPKPKKSAKDHQIERLKREKRDLMRQLRSGGANTELLSRMERLEKGLQGGNGSDTKPKEVPPPDPTDAKKYPLGHLDDRYIEDKLDWLTDKKAAERVEAILDRHQENEQQSVPNVDTEELLERVEDIAAKGVELGEDFYENVVETGMRGEWKCGRATFEACADADNGAQILLDLSQDKKEAARVAKLSDYQQMKYVAEKDAEIAAAKKPRTKPKAGEPPKNQARGANSRTKINPATDNLDDFEKAWKQDEKASH